MKFFIKKLHVELSKVRPSKKRKRSSNHEVTIKKARVEAMEEWMEPASPASSILTALILASLFRITKTSPEATVEMSNPCIEVGADAKLEVEFGSHYVKEGDVGSDEGAPLLS